VLDWSTVLSSLAAQAPLTALAIVLVYFTLKREIEKVRADLRSEFGVKIESSKKEIHNEIEDLRRELHSEIESVKKELHGEIKELYGEINGLRSELGSAKSELSREIRSLKVEVADLKFRVAGVERALQGFGETLVEFLAAKGVVSEPERVALRGFLAAALPPARSKYYTEEVRRRLLELLEKDDVTAEDVRELDRISDLIYKEYLETGREDLIKYYYKLRIYIALLAGLLRSKAKQEGGRRG
jgi:DNA repair exonuclease SbcCD ATPase subunit